MWSLEPEAKFLFDVVANNVTESEFPFNVYNNVPFFGFNTLTEHPEDNTKITNYAQIKILSIYKIKDLIAKQVTVH